MYRNYNYWKSNRNIAACGRRTRYTFWRKKLMEEEKKVFFNKTILRFLGNIIKVKEK